jgi:hypothetical protein
VRSFEVRVSTTITDSAAFTTVLSETAANVSRLQEFLLPAPVQAKYVQLFIRDNYGSTSYIAVNSFESVDPSQSGILLLDFQQRAH